MREQIPKTENDESIASLLGGLKRVDAPENFEFGVKARISNGEPKEAASPFALLKIAVPTAALAGLAAFLYISGFMSGDIPTVQVAKETTRPASTERETGSYVLAERETLPTTESNPVLNSRETQIASARPNGANNKSRGGSIDRTDPSKGGSIDQTLNPDRPIRRVVPAQRVLETAGISAEFQGDRCVTNSVSGSAERLGVKTGDVILSVNDVSIKPSTTFEEGVEIKSVRVKRSGRNLKLNF